MNEREDILKKLEEIREVSLIGAKEILTTKEACLFTGLKINYLYELVRNRKIPHHKSRGGKMTYFKKKDLEEWMLGTRVSSLREMETEAARRIRLS